MLHLSRPQALAATSPSRPSDRRERHPLQPVTGYPNAPIFDRSDLPAHPAAASAAQARSAVAADNALARIIHMATTGVWVMKRHGRMLEIDGRCHWNCQRELAADARRAGVALSDLVVNTGSHA